MDTTLAQLLTDVYEAHAALGQLSQQNQALIAVRDELQATVAERDAQIETLNAELAILRGAVEAVPDAALRLVAADLPTQDEPEAAS